MDALLDDEEGLGVRFEELLLEVFDLVLVQAYAEDVGILAGVDALPLPAGDAAVEVVQNEVVQFRAFRLGKDEHLDIDALLVGPVDGNGLEDGVEDRVDHGGDIKEQAAQQEQGGIACQIHLSDSEPGPSPGQDQAQGVQSAAGAAAGEHQTGSHAGDHSTQEAAGEDVIHQGGRRYRHQTDKQGVGGGADHGVAEKDGTHKPPGNGEERNIDSVKDHTGQIKGQAGDMEGGQNQRSQQLTDTHKPAGVQAQRGNKQIDAQSIDQTSQYSQDETAPAGPHGGFQHFLKSPFPRGFLPRREKCSRLKAVLQAPSEPFPATGDGPGYGGLVDPQLMGHLGHGKTQIVIHVEHFCLAGCQLRFSGPAEVPAQALELLAVVLTVCPVPSSQVCQYLFAAAGVPVPIRACSAHCCDTSCRSIAPVPGRSHGCPGRGRSDPGYAVPGGCARQDRQKPWPRPAGR